MKATRDITKCLSQKAQRFSKHSRRTRVVAVCSLGLVALLAGCSGVTNDAGDAGSLLSGASFYFLLGLALSASCGFRVFVPPLVIGIGVKAGEILIQNPALSWMGSWPAIIIFGIASSLEICGYFIPWVDNLLDSIAVPAAAVAGTVVMASFISASPATTWVLAAIVGGGTSSAVELGTVVLRGASTTTTGGLTNPAVSGAELAASGGVSLMAVFLPLVAAIMLLLLAVVGVYLIVRRISRRKEPISTV